MVQCAQSGPEWPKWPRVAQKAQNGPNGPEWPKWGKVAQTRQCKLSKNGLVLQNFVGFRSVREKLQFTVPLDHPVPVLTIRLHHLTFLLDLCSFPNFYTGAEHPDVKSVIHNAVMEEVSKLLH